ncbi:zinc ribbon domain-containing protein [Clostridium perfringens]|nr:zinc ribbon domain-containing protein [Clostridium perfringens]
MKDKLLKIWQLSNTKQFAGIFEEYMKELGVRKYDGRRKDNSNSYLIDAKSTGWNRVQCFYHKDSTEYGEENLLVVLRKEAGNYFIIQRKGERAFESDYSGIRHYDEELMKEILGEHRILFDKFFEAIGDKSKYQELLNKNKAKKVVKTENVSQACPVCKYPVNWKYCPNCGQRLKW